MRLKIILILSAILLCFSCRTNGKKPAPTPEDLPDDVSLIELEVNGESILEKLDDSATYSFGEVKKYSVDVKVKSKTENAIITVGTDYIQADGKGSSFTAYISDGENVLKIVSISPKDANNRKVYTVKIIKKDTGTAPSSSSKLKELKVDNVDVLLKMKHNVCTLDDVKKDKDNVSVKVKVHNSSATILVTNKDAPVLDNGNASYNVTLLPGLNAIKVIVTSEEEGAKCHVINIYKEEDLSLQTFKVDEKEYYDSGKDKLSTSSVTFPEEKQSLMVKAKAKSENVSLKFKVNGNEINADGDAYPVNLVFGRNNAELVILGGDGKHSNIYKIVFYRASPDSDSDVLVSLKADDVDLIPLLSADKTVTLKAVQNEKASLKLEARSSSATVKVKNGATEVQATDSIFNVPLHEGANRIEVLLYDGNTLKSSYFVFIRRNPKLEEVPSPSNSEVTVSVFVSDGVNGSPVDGTKLLVFKTTENSITPLKTLTIINGKTKLNLKKGEFYDFKLEGLNDETAYTRYAASQVISQYIDENNTVVPMIQCPLLMLPCPIQAPEMKEFKFGSTIVAPGNMIDADEMDRVHIKLLTSSSIEEEARFGTPVPMLAVGFVPTKDSSSDSGVVQASIEKNQKKLENGKYESAWRFSSNAEFIKGEARDIVVVAYDKAANRLEYHVRVNAKNTTEEKDNLSVEDFKLEFKRLPTPSTLFSVGEDSGTGSSTHYDATFQFVVRQGSIHVRCIGFDLYRRCVTDNEDFKIVKHFVYNTPKTSNANTKHFLKDSDGVLEDEKTYEYKIVAYTLDGKKSMLSKSPIVSLTVPKSNTVVLQYPVDTSVSTSQVEQSGYKFRFTNPKILETAKEMKLGFILTNRAGIHYWGIKFKYVFDDGGSQPELYFAQSNDEIVDAEGYKGTRYSMKRTAFTNKSVDEFITINKDTGEVIIRNAFFTTAGIPNLSKHGAMPSYEVGDVYCWDIVDFGLEISKSFEDLPLEVISKEINGTTIISPAKDGIMGNNAWNGRAEFTIKAN